MTATAETAPKQEPAPETKNDAAAAAPPAPEPAKDPAKDTSADVDAAAAACDFDPSADFKGDVQVSQALPTKQDVEKCQDLLVLGADGESRPFKSLYSGEGVASRQLIIFVRHFFCGNCQEFLRTLCASITPDALLALPTPTFVTVVGCGRPELISMYAATTNCPFPIFADPTTKLYSHFGMLRTLSMGQKKPDYIKASMVQTTVHSMIQGIKSGKAMVQGGDIRQVGGEMLFEDGQVTWVHRMKNTRDHSEIGELRRVLGLTGKDEGRRYRNDGFKAMARSMSWNRKSDRARSSEDRERRRREKDIKEQDVEKEQKEQKEQKKIKRKSLFGGVKQEKAEKSEKTEAVEKSEQPEKEKDMAL